MSDSDTLPSEGRRDVLRKAGTTVMVGAGLASVVDVGAADTSSGSVELTTTATVPTSTGIDITIYEDTTGDGTADRQQTKSISGGTNTYVYDLLESTTAQGDTLWLEVGLSTSDDTTTPTLDSATITLPTTPDTGDGGGGGGVSTPDKGQSLGALWKNYQVFVVLVTLFYTFLGALSKSLAVAAWSGYLAFIYLALDSSNGVFRGIALVTLVLTFLGMAFKLIRLELDADR